MTEADNRTQTRLRLSLDSSVQVEAAFLEAYKSLPRSRAQAFLRDCLLRGFQMAAAGASATIPMAAQQASAAKPGRANPVPGFFGEHQ